MHFIFIRISVVATELTLLKKQQYSFLHLITVLFKLIRIFIVCFYGVNTSALTGVNAR